MGVLRPEGSAAVENIRYWLADAKRTWGGWTWSGRLMFGALLAVSAFLYLTD